MISHIDLAVISVYFLLVLSIGFVVGTRTRTGEDLFLGGRSFGWGLIGLSLFASNISSTTLIGLAGAAYQTGIAHSVYEWGAGIPFVLLAFVFVPLYLRARITTVPEFLERRFDRRSRLLFSGVTIFTSIVVDTAGGLYAGAIVLQTFFPHLVMWQTCALLALVAGTYTAFGGLKAVVYTDALQAIILIAGASVLAYKMFGLLDYSWSNVSSGLDRQHLSMIRPASDANLPWPGLLSVPLLGFWYVATNQYIVQRILGARDIQQARWGIMFASLLKFLPLFIMVLPGVMAIGLFPDLSNPDLVFPTMVREVLPIGMIGLVLAALVAAIMSSVDSTLNSASTLIVVDFLTSEDRIRTPVATARLGRIATLVLMVIAAAWAPMIENFGGLWLYLQQMFSVIAPPVVVVFLLGAFYHRGTATAAFWTLCLGMLLGVAIFALDLAGVWPLHFLVNVGVMTAASMSIFVGVSLFSAPPDAATLARYCFSIDLLANATSGLAWYKDYRYQSAGILLLIGLHYVALW